MDYTKSARLPMAVLDAELDSQIDCVPNAGSDPATWAWRPAIADPSRLGDVAANCSKRTPPRDYEGQ